MDDLDRYRARISEHAKRDLDAIYVYIAETFLKPEMALSLVGEIEKGILSLDTMPHRCPIRKIGAYANLGYHQLFVKNYTIIFRIDEKKKRVIIITVRYSTNQFLFTKAILHKEK